MAISTRFRAPSLRIRLARWDLTVLMLMKRSSAISLLVRPWATRIRTSSSRLVRGSMGCAGGGLARTGPVRPRPGRGGRREAARCGAAGGDHRSQRRHGDRRDPQPAELIRHLAAHRLAAEAAGNRVLVHATTKAAVSQIAFDNRIRVVALTDATRSLEESLLDMTRASAEVAST